MHRNRDAVSRRHLIRVREPAARNLSHGDACSAPWCCGMQNEVESLRLKTKDYEMILAQHGNFTLIVIQQTANKKKGEEDKEGEAAAPAEAKKD